jgi:SAM-dependent methyltransferase/CelD/BcsL family acetyltransferase involved in cellulose biosynthesis
VERAVKSLASVTPPRGSRFHLTPLRPADIHHWDALIEPYETRTLFHGTPWLSYLSASRGLVARRWALEQDGRIVGYFCAGVLRRGPFRILGSPLRGWGTNAMGPLVSADLDQAGFLGALDELARRERLAMVEIEHPFLDSTTMDAAGFERVPEWTYVVRLDSDPRVMWRSLSSACRNRIRKAESAGLTVEDASDPAVVDEYYKLYRRLMRRKGRRPPFGRDVPGALFEHLRPAGALLALRVKDQEDRVLAVGLFPHGAGTLYFWSGASREDGHHSCPNDLMHWTAMRLAAARGLRAYNMSGHGRFKRKFGGRLVETARWHKAYRASARSARQIYQAWSERLTTYSPAALWLGWPAGGRTGTAARNNPDPRRPRPLAFRVSDIVRAPLHDFPIRDEIVSQYLPVSADMDCLEIGPGSGITAFRLARSVRTLTLVDVASGNVANLMGALRERANVRVVCADVCKPGLAATLGRTFDVAYALEVFELLPDPATCLENLAQVTKPGGHVLLQFPNYPPPQSPGMTHFRSRSELNALLEAVGFTSWELHALRLRRFAGVLYEHAHERPIRVYRRRRRSVAEERPLVYDESWAFRHGRRLEPLKYMLHAWWATLAATMRLGGPAFERIPLGDDILHRNLMVLARR